MEYETFDINQYKSKMNEWGNLAYTFTKEDGTIVHISASNQKEIDVIETPPAPYFYIMPDGIQGTVCFHIQVDGPVQTG